MSAPSISFATRLWFAFVCFARVLFDGDFAARAFQSRDALPEPPPTKALAEVPASPPKLEAPREDRSALHLLALLQSSGRFLDFLEEDVTTFSDADVGAVARVVHDGCKKTLRQHVPIAPVRTENEGARVTIERGYEASKMKLTGNVRGDGPWTGELRHRGWRAESLSLPTLLEGADPKVLAPAEVEL